MIPRSWSAGIADVRHARPEHLAYEMTPSDRRPEPKRSGVSGVIRQVTHLGWDALPGIGFDAEDPPRGTGGLITRAQPACRRPTAAFSIVGSSSSTAFAAGPSGMKLSSLVTREVRPA
jgi:hypothetical protein